MRYMIFCSGSVLKDFGEDDAGANGANAEALLRHRRGLRVAGATYQCLWRQRS